MALLNCPECSQNVSSEADICPHCGYPLKKLKLVSNNDNNCTSGQLYVLVPRRPYSIAPSVIFVVFGLLTSLIIVGIVLIVLGISSIVELNQNNKNPLNCAYYDSSKDEVILVSYNGLIYKVKPSDIIDNSHPAGDADMYVKIKKDGIEQRINCGVCLIQESVKFKEQYTQMKNGTFDPSSLPVSKDIL